jgi:predicted MFS family arabinose efflux permease
MRRALGAYALFGTAELATWVALLVWAFDRGGATASGIIAVAQLIPATLVAPLGSALADRMDRPRALRLGYLLQAVTNLATAAVLFLGAGFWVVAVAAAAAASAMTLTRPVHHALMPEIARTPDELTAGNTASTGVEGAAGFVGPVLGGVLLAVTGAGWVFVAMGAAGLVGAALTRGIRVVQVATGETSPSYWADAAEGMRVVVQEPAAGVLTVLVGGQYVLVGLLDVLAVVLALELLGMGPAGPGLIGSALGVGALVGAAIAVGLVGRRRLTPAVAIGIVVASLPIAVVPATASFVAAVLLFGLAGAGNAYFDVAARTLLQRNVAPRVLARIFGVQEALLMAGTAAGAAAVPVLVALFGATGAFVAAGSLLPLLGLAAWTRVRRLDDRSVLPGPTLDLLRRVPMFGVLPSPQLEQLAFAATPVAPVTAGSVAIEQGAAGDRYYVIVAGRADIERDGRTVATLGPGQGFGEIALLRDVPRTATVRAVDDLELLALEREPFLLAVTGSERSLRSATRTVDAMLIDADTVEDLDTFEDPDEDAPAVQ